MRLVLILAALALASSSALAQGIVPNCGVVKNGMNFTIIVTGPEGQPLGRVAPHSSRRFCVGR